MHLTALHRILHVIGALFVTAGVLLAGLVVVQAGHAAVFSRVDRVVPYVALTLDPPPLPLPDSPSVPVQVPQAPDLTVAVRPAMTPTPSPLPPIRLQIPALNMDWPVMTSKPVRTARLLDGIAWEWDLAENGVSYLPISSRPGAGGNVVISGHNNFKGEAFRRLPDAQTGDVVVLHTPLGAHYYAVTETIFVPYRRNPGEGEAQLAYYSGDFGEERLTLLSCYPYWTNADRIVVVAHPVSLAALGGVGDGVGGAP